MTGNAVRGNFRSGSAADFRKRPFIEAGKRSALQSFAPLCNGEELCGVEVGRYMFRVGKDLEAEALARPGARPMDITGKPMRGLVWVNADDAFEAGLPTWIDLAERFVRTLPPK